MINAYDFDGTIYDGDSSVDFYLYCLKKKPLIIIYAPIQIFAALMYALKIKNKDYMKEKIFIYLRMLKDTNKYVNDFWKSHRKNIKEWYEKQKKDSDVIISASPEFLLKPLEKDYNFHVIATKVNPNTGKFESRNCHDYEKINRFEKEYKNKKVKEFYTDSIKADKAMLEYAKKGYLVKKNIITEYKPN